MSNFKNTPNHSIKHGDKEIWVSRSVSVVVSTILFKNNEQYVPLIKRGISMHSPGKWCLPCGYLDWDETANEAAIREVWEETGMDLRKLDAKVSTKWLEKPWDINTEPNLNPNQDIAIHFGVVIESNSFPELTSENSEEDEISELKWVNIRDLELYDMAFNHDKRIYKFLNTIENGNL